MTKEIDPLGAFDKKVLKHFMEEGEGILFRGTRAALVKGLDVYVGISQCVSFDQFNRRKGYKIAQGRALQAWKEDAEIESKTSLRKHSGQFYFKVTAESVDEIDSILIKYVFMDQPKPV